MKAKLYKSCTVVFLFFLCIVVLYKDQTLYAGEPYPRQDLPAERGIIYGDFNNENNKQQTQLRRNAWLESERGVYRKSDIEKYFSGLTFDLGRITSEDATFDNKGRPLTCNQVIYDPANPNIGQQRSFGAIQYNENDKPVSYREEIFITARDYFSESAIRLLSTEDIYKIEYNASGEAITILGNTETVISNDKGNTLLTVKGSFTKRAKCDIYGKVMGYYRYGIDNIVVADGLGEIIVTAPPLLTETEGSSEYRVGIVNVVDEEALQQILNSQSFIKQLLSRFGLAELFYKAFYSKKLYSSLSYLEIQNTPEEIMSLNSITLAFKNLIQERQRAYSLFQNDVDAYYNKLSGSLFENIQLWWDKDIPPQEYYAGEDKILDEAEYRKMVDDAIVSLSSNMDTYSSGALPQQILSLEQYLRTQMIANSKLIYVESLKDAVSQMNKEISLTAQDLNRPVLIRKKDSIEALIALPEKQPAQNIR